MDINIYNKYMNIDINIVITTNIDIKYSIYTSDLI